MKTEELISASWFYFEENQKCKLNWFLFEYACKLYEAIKKSKGKALAKWKSKLGDERLAEFCAYYAKRMRDNVYRVKYIGEGAELVDEVYLYDYCHTNTRTDNAAILKVCEAAFIDLLESCVVCPVGCLDEMVMPCEFFDRMERGGYFS